MQNFFRLSQDWHDAVPTLNRTILLVGIVIFIEAAFFFLNRFTYAIPPVFLSGLMRTADLMVLLLWGTWSFKAVNKKMATHEGIVLTFVVAAAGLLLLAFFKKLTGFSLIKLKHPSFYYHGTTLIVFYLTRCLISPVAEELFFRGLLYRNMRQRYGIWSSILVVSLVFALLHNNRMGVPFLGSLIFCMGYEKTKSILTPILLHISGNAILYLSPYIGFI